MLKLFENFEEDVHGKIHARAEALLKDAEAEKNVANLPADKFVHARKDSAYQILMKEFPLYPRTVSGIVVDVFKDLK